MKLTHSNAYSTVLRSACAGVLSCLLFCSEWHHSGAQPGAQPGFNGAQPATPINMENNTRGRVPGNPENAVQDLKRLFQVLQTYRERHGGAFPFDSSALNKELIDNFASYDFKSAHEAFSFRLNPDARYADDMVARANPEQTLAYKIFFKRPDGAAFGTPKLPGAKDLLSYTGIYYHRNLHKAADGTPMANPVGYYVVLWDDGTVEKVPYDLMYFVPRASNSLVLAFHGQSALPWNCLTYDEFYTQYGGPFDLPPRGKPVPDGRTVPVEDNGGPEALIALSRIAGLALERESIWNHLDIAQENFTLEDLSSAAAKLGWSCSIQTKSLDEIRRSGQPAIVDLKEPHRLVTLTAIGANHSLLYDGGMKLIVENAALSQRYTKRALLLNNQTTAAQISIENPVQAISIKDVTADVSQTITLTNRSDKTLTLSPEQPLCGVTELGPVSLQIAPGQSAKVNCKLRWRPHLKGAKQYVTITFGSGAVPGKVQAGFLLNLDTHNLKPAI